MEIQSHPPSKKDYFYETTCVCVCATLLLISHGEKTLGISFYVATCHRITIIYVGK